MERKSNFCVVLRIYLSQLLARENNQYSKLPKLVDFFGQAETLSYVEFSDRIHVLIEINC